MRLAPRRERPLERSRGGRYPGRGAGQRGARRRTAIEDQIRALALKDGRYSPEAFRFLFESLPHATKLAGKEEAEGAERHVTGQEVLAGMRAYAQQLFGPLSAAVWRSWGVKASIDWGEIVFLLVENGMLNRQESDSVEDFRAGFDFDEVFVRRYRVPLPDPSGGIEEA